MFLEILSHTLRSRCPVCAEGRLFAPLMHLKNLSEILLPRENCDQCYFKFARQPGYLFGVVTPILPILSLLLGAVFCGVSYFGFHQELETVLVWGAVGLACGFLVFFRTAVAIYIAFDHAIDPPSDAG